MPTYEYRCTACDARLEVVQRFSDDPLTTCEECGGTLKRIFHPVGVVLKGSGFYATDNRSGKSLSPGETSKSESKDTPKKSSSSESSSKASGSKSAEAS
jgi:putative FmdB family regulatory protein